MIYAQQKSQKCFNKQGKDALDLLVLKKSQMKKMTQATKTEKSIVIECLQGVATNWYVEKHNELARVLEFAREQNVQNSQL